MADGWSAGGAPALEGGDGGKGWSKDAGKSWGDGGGAPALEGGDGGKGWSKDGGKSWGDGGEGGKAWGKGDGGGDGGKGWSKDGGGDAGKGWSKDGGKSWGDGGDGGWGESGKGWSGGSGASQPSGKEAVKGLAIMMKGMMMSLKGKGKDGGDSWSGDSWSGDSWGAKGDGGWGGSDGWGDGGKGKGDGGKGKGKDDGGKGQWGKDAKGGKEWKPAWQNVSGADYSDHKRFTYVEGDGVGIDGLKDAITRALEPYMQNEEVGGDTDWDSVIERMCFTFFKTADRYWKDDKRHKDWKPSATMAQCLLECFAHKVLEALEKLFYEKPWFREVYLSEAMALAAIRCFKVPGGCVFSRTVAPVVVTQANDAIFRYREEQRIQEVIADAVRAMGIREEFEKKATKHLSSAYDSCFFGAEYGVCQAASPELGQIQDFLKHWMEGFCQRGWDVLESGLASTCSTGEKIAAMTILFQYVTDPEHNCLPHDLLTQLESPPSNVIRDFITRTATTLLVEQDAK